MKQAIVTGAGSGVGRAVALRLLAGGWRVGLVGRRAETLAETAALATAGEAVALPCDVADAGAVARAFADFGPIDVLVNAAGTNVARRSLDVVTAADFRQLVDANLTGAFHCVHAALPPMRKRGGGTIVNVVSDAGLVANSKAGPAYVASKFGLVGLTQSINAEERGRGVRACAICPGDINTPLLDKRPAPPPVAAREAMLQPEDLVACVMLVIDLPPRAVVEQLVVRPR
jgi:NAD(P)-dependent dehydrogenase (short-subunit alcohol dehydrogenase family)